MGECILSILDGIRVFNFFFINTLGTKDSSSFQVCPFLWSFAEVKQLKISFYLSLGPLIYHAMQFRPIHFCTLARSCTGKSIFGGLICFLSA